MQVCGCLPYVEDQTSELGSVYIYLVTNYFNPTILTTVVWSVVAEVMVNGVMALLVQFFFVFRAWKRKSFRLTVARKPLCLLAIFQ